ncbi:MAG: hypothetical protein ACI8ZO_001199 [Flavobacteriales bacterium]|jgi:hypothetical protein
MTHTPEITEYASYYKGVMELVDTDNIIHTLKSVHVETQDLLSSLTEEQGVFRYAEGKWSIKDVIQHCIDCERVFAYRALRISRGDTNALSGFDQDEWVANTNVSKRTIEELANEAFVVRSGTIALFESFTIDQLMLLGNASNNALSVRSIGFIIPGHERHHINVIKERYL